MWGVEEKIRTSSASKYEEEKEKEMGDWQLSYYDAQVRALVGAYYRALWVKVSHRTRRFIN